MPEADFFADSYVVIEMSDAEERTCIASMLRQAGAPDITFADNVLELVLESLKIDMTLIVSEKNDHVIGLSEALRFIVEHDRYATIAVIADSWADESMDGLLGLVDVFVTRPVTVRGLVPGISVDAAKKKHMMELEQELGRSEASFAKEKNMSFAEHVIMDTLGLSRESAGEYISSLAEKHGYDKNDVAKIVYEIILAGGKD